MRRHDAGRIAKTEFAENIQRPQAFLCERKPRRAKTGHAFTRQLFKSFLIVAAFAPETRRNFLRERHMCMRMIGNFVPLGGDVLDKSRCALGYLPDRKKRRAGGRVYCMQIRIRRVIKI